MYQLLTYKMFRKVMENLQKILIMFVSDPEHLLLIKNWMKQLQKQYTE